MVYLRNRKEGALLKGSESHLQSEFSSGVLFLELFNDPWAPPKVLFADSPPTS
jgi:hypothetical protein